jgi:membrane-associated phospholipid phosphatase
VVLLILFGVGLVALVAMAVAAHSLAYFPGDVTVSHAVQAYASDSLDKLTSAVSWTGFPPQSWLVFGVVVVALALLGYRWAALVAALAAVGSGELYFVVQQLVGRPRPSADLVHVAGALPMSGFPSGHVATFAAVFGFVAFVAYRRLSPSAARWAPVALVAGLLVLMSLARIYSGQHWPSDVLAGLLLGGLWLSLLIWLYEWGLVHSPVQRLTSPRERSLRMGWRPRSAVRSGWGVRP